MRTFIDQDGATWTAEVAEESGHDYKGRYYFRLAGASGETVALEDIRWNSERTARRTLETMSVVELRRRLRSARGRTLAPAAF